jgi:hypothetical protein
VRRLVAATLLVAGILLGLVGLFLIAYSGDGDTYIRFRDEKIDADLVGAFALLRAFRLVVAAIALLRRRAW